MTVSVIGFGPTIVFAEDLVNATPVLLDGDVEVEASGSLAGGWLIVTGLLAEDRVSILVQGTGVGQIDFNGTTVTYGGVAIGTATGGVGNSFSVAFNAAVTTPALDALIQRLSFANVSDLPFPGRLLSLDVRDALGEGLAEPASIFVVVNPVNDVPVITSAGSAAFVENGTGIAYQARMTDPDLPTNLTPWSLGGTDAALFTINIVTGAVRFTAAPDFEAPRDANGDNRYEITVTATDGLGASTTRDVSIAVTDLTRVAILADFQPVVTIASGAVPQLLDPSVTFIAGDSLAGGGLVLAGLLAEDRVLILAQGSGAGQIGLAGSTVTYGGTAIGTAAGGVGGDFTVAFNDAVTEAAVEALIERLAYANASATPSATRRLTLDVVDAAGGHLAAGRAQFKAESGAGDPLDGIEPWNAAPAFVDLDGDGRLDLVVGDAFGALLAWRNTGNAYVALDGAANPFATIIVGGAKPAFVDLDSDGRLDLVVGNFAGTLLAWQNTASGYVPLTGAANPLAGIGVGGTSAPAFVDLDSDGRLDLVVGTWGGLRVWRNTEAGYVALTGEADPFGGLTFNTGRIVPAFVDLDGDGRLDLVARATYAVPLQAWRNTVDGYVPLTGGATGTINPVADIFVANGRGNYFDVQPAFTDLDGDGRADLVVGTFLGLQTWLTRDAALPPVFVAMDGLFGRAANPFAGVDVGSLSKPTVTDLDGDGRLDLVVGNSDGMLLSWRNTGSGFVALTGAANPLAGITVPLHAAPAFVDLDRDGRLDLVIGTADGDLRAWRGTGGGYVALTGAANPFDGIDVSSEATPSFVDFDADGLLDLVVGRTDSTLLAWRNTGSGYVALTGAANPFDGIGLRSDFIAPSFVDLDGDGRLDLLAGGNQGTFGAWRNTGAGFLPLGDPNRFGGLEAGVRGAPAFIDLDGDGRLDLVAGATSGQILAWRNVTPLPAITVIATDAPLFASPSALRFAENGLGIAYQAVATDPAGPGAITWSLAGADAALFGIDAASGAVRFLAPAGPDFEAPQDAGGDGTYDIIVIAQGSAATTQQAVAITVTDLREGARLGGFAPALIVAENGVNAAPRLLDADVAFTAGDSLAGGRLVVSGLLAEDRLSILAEGGGAGQIGLAGSTVTYGGTAIGTAAGGVGADFTVTFTAAATGPAVDALIQRLAYANASDTPTWTRSLALNVVDGSGSHLPANPMAQFTALDGAANPFAGINLTRFSKPAFVDLNGDGLLDLVSGLASPPSGASFLAAWRNTGSGYVELRPDFSLPLADRNPFLNFNLYQEDWGNSAPTFVDLNGDGRLDLVLGGGDGKLLGWLKAESFVPTVGSQYVAMTGAANIFDGIRVYNRSTPTFVDLDGDGALDLVSGELGGTLLAWRNTGSGYQPLDGLAGHAANPFAGIDVGDYGAPAFYDESAPAFVDLDADGRLDLVVGQKSGTLLAWRNTGSGYVVLLGQDNPFAGIDVGGYSAPTFVDLDGDGRLDLVAGSEAGALMAWRNTATTPTITVTVTAENDRPVITSPSALRVAENGTGIAYQMAVTDPDGPAPLTYRLTPTGGQFVENPDGSASLMVQAGFWGGLTPLDDTALFTIDATGALRFLETPDFETPRDLDGDNVYRVAVAVTDGTGLDAPRSTSVVFLSITVTDLRETATLTGLAPLVVFFENTVNAAPQLLDADVVFTPGDSLAGGHLVVSGLLAEDRVTVLGQGIGAGQIGFNGSAVTYGGVTIGTATGGVGGNFTVAFNAAVTGAAVDALIQRLGYGNASDAPTASRMLSLDVVDGLGVRLAAAPAITVGVLPEIDRPVITSPSAVTFAENGADIAYQGMATTPDGPGTNNTWLLGGADAALFGIDAASGAVRFLAAPDFEAPRDAGGDNVYNLSVVTLGGGSSLAVTDKAITITVTDTRETATLTGLGPAVAFAENTVNAAPQLLDADVMFTQGDSLAGGRLVVSGLLAEDRLTLLAQGTGTGQIGFNGTTVTYGGVTIGTATGGVGGDFTVNFTAAATGAAVDALIQRLGYGNASDLPLPGRMLTFDVVDAQGGHLTPPATMFVAVNGENDRPVITSPSAATFAENGTGIVYRGQFTDTDGPGWPVPWMLRNADAHLFTIDASGALRFAAAPDFEAPRDANGDNVYEILLQVTDGIGNGYQEVAITVSDVRETATLAGLGPAVAFAENTVNAAPQLLDADVMFTQGDSLAGGRLVVTGLLAEDRISVLGQGGGAGQIGVIGSSITYGANPIGTVTGGVGGDFTVNFTGAVTGAAVDALIQRLGYANTSDLPFPLRRLTLDVVDAQGDHLAAPPTIAVAVNPENDRPVITSPSTASFAENGTGIVYQARFTDIDGPGSALPWLLFGDDAPLFAVDPAGAVRFRVAPDFEAPRDRASLTPAGDNVYNIQLQATDGASSVLKAVAITVTDVRETATLTGLRASVVFDENTVNAAPQLLDANVEFTQGDRLAGGRLVVTGLLAEDRLSVLGQGGGAGQIGVIGSSITYGANPIGTVTGGVGGDFTVNFTGAVTGAAVDALIQRLGYANTSDAPTASRTLTLDVVDGLGARLAATAAIGVGITPQNDAPVLALPIPDQRVAEDTMWSYQLPAGSFTDADGTPVNYSASLANGSALPAWLTFVAATRSFSGTPPQNFNGGFSLTVTASDGRSSAADSFTLTVTPVNDAPVAVADSVAVNENGTTPNLWSSLLSNDRDVDAGDSRVIESVAAASTLGSTIVFDAALRSVRYVANADLLDQLATGATAVDSFVYTIADNAGARSTATVTVTVTGVADGIILVGGRANDSLTGTTGEDTISGAGGMDVIRGNDGADLLRGGSGDDGLNGGAGRDTLSGGNGDDLLEGDLGDDVLNGGAGLDILVGGAGMDVLIGGAAADVFRYGFASEGLDRIADFRGAQDRIEVSAAGFGGGLVEGMNLATAGRYLSNLTGLSDAARGQFVFETDARTLWWDADGIGAGGREAIATLTGLNNLAASDLVVIA